MGKKNKFVSVLVALSCCIVPMTLGNTSIDTAQAIDLKDTVWRFDENIDLYDLLGGIGQDSYQINFYTVSQFGGVDQFSSIILAMDYTANGGSQIVYEFDGYTSVVYDNSYVADGWALDSYRTIYITGGDTAVLDSFYQNILSVYADNITETHTSSFNVFQTIYDLLNDLFFYGTVSMGDNSMQALILLGLTSIFTIGFIVMPFVVIYWIIRFLGRLFNAV